MRFSIGMTAFLAATQVKASDDWQEFAEQLQALAEAFANDPEGFLNAAQTAIMDARTAEIDQTEEDLAYLQSSLENWWNTEIGRRTEASYNLLQCYSWNNQSWAGVAPTNPAWTVCGNTTCTPCGSLDTACYDFSQSGPGVEKDCDETRPSFMWNGIKWEGGDCNPNPWWTECGCETCTRYDSRQKTCYDFYGGPGVERECDSFMWNNTKWAGSDCNPNPAWTPCGCGTCTRFDTNETECYDTTVRGGSLPVADCYNFPLNLQQATNDAWAPLQELVDVINAIGENPSAFMTE